MLCPNASYAARDAGFESKWARKQGSRLMSTARIRARIREIQTGLARDPGLDPVQMALAFVNSWRFLTSNIIGATTTGQLAANLDSEELVLSDEVLEEIAAIHAIHANPAP